MSVRYDKLVPALKRLLEEDRIDVIGRSVASIRRLRQLSASSFRLLRREDSAARWTPCRSSDDVIAEMAIGSSP